MKKEGNINEMYFYHSFPREGNDKSKVERGKEILESMIARGFLLFPDYIAWAEKMGFHKAALPLLQQQRICFSFIRPVELPDHSQEWGPYSIEFSDELLELGAMPVLNMPTTYNSRSTAQHTLIQNLFDALKALELRNNRPRHRSFGFGIKGIKGIFGLLYPAEGGSSDSRLKNYSLREWRITGNTLQFFAEKYRFECKLEPNDIKELEFIPDDKLNDTLKFTKFLDKPVLSYAKRVVVPDREKNEIQAKIGKLEGKKPAVVSYTEFEKEYNLKGKKRFHTEKNC